MSAAVMVAAAAVAAAVAAMAAAGRVGLVVYMQRIMVMLPQGIEMDVQRVAVVMVPNGIQRIVQRIAAVVQRVAKGMVAVVAVAVGGQRSSALQRVVGQRFFLTSVHQDQNCQGGEQKVFFHIRKKVC